MRVHQDSEGEYAGSRRRRRAARKKSLPPFVLKLLSFGLCHGHAGRPTFSINWNDDKLGVFRSCLSFETPVYQSSGNVLVGSVQQPSTSRQHGEKLCMARNRVSES